MMLRAELPVQRNKTLKGRSSMRELLLRADGRGSPLRHQRADHCVLPTQQARFRDVQPVLTLLERLALPIDGLRGHVNTLFVARDGEIVVGSAALEVYGEGALLRSVAVAPEYQRVGLGRRLIDVALDSAWERGVPSVYLLTTTAEPYFAKLGFARIDRDQVPADVQRSIEFTSACPSSATVVHNFAQTASIRPRRRPRSGSGGRTRPLAIL